VNAFEEDLKPFVGKDKEAVALSSGMAAVHLAMIACLFYVSVHTIKYLGTISVLVDSEPDS